MDNLSNIAAMVCVAAGCIFAVIGVGYTILILTVTAKTFIKKINQARKRDE